MLAYGECLRCGHAVTLVSIVPAFDQDHEVFTFACRECQLPREVRCVVLIGMLPDAWTPERSRPHQAERPPGLPVERGRLAERNPDEHLTQLGAPVAARP
jgi:hypothetical protein